MFLYEILWPVSSAVRKHSQLYYLSSSFSSIVQENLHFWHSNVKYEQIIQSSLEKSPKPCFGMFVPNIDYLLAITIEQSITSLDSCRITCYKCSKLSSLEQYCQGFLIQEPVDMRSPVHDASQPI